MFLTDCGETFNQANRREYAQQKGEEETARIFESISNPSEWDEPEPIREELLPVETLREEMIPEALLPMVQDVAARMSVPLDFVAVPLVVVLGSLIGTGCRIRPKRKDDWAVTCNLWAAIIGNPSALKTPALNEVMRRTVDRLEAKITKSTAGLKPNGNKRRKLPSWIKTRSKWRTKQRRKRRLNNMRSSDEILQELKSLSAGDAPKEIRRKVNDASIEKIVDILQNNAPRGLLFHRDELVAFFRKLEKPGHEQDRAFFLEAWTGDGSHTDDRIGRGTTRAENLCISLCGTIQPGRFCEYISESLTEAGDDGFPQRLQCAVYPDPVPFHYVDEWPDKDAKNRVYKIAKRLAESEFDITEGFQNDDVSELFEVQ